MLVVSDGGLLLDANPAACDVLGLRREELVGARLRDLADPSDPRWEGALEGHGVGEVGTLELRMRRSDGACFAVEASVAGSLEKEGRRHPSGLVFRVRETSEEEAGESARLGWAIVENGHDLITIRGVDSIISHVSPSVERVLGYGSGELLGVHALDLVHPEDQGVAQAAGSIATNTDEGLPSLRLRRKDGAYIYVASRTSNTLQDPIAKGIVVDRRHITQRKQTEGPLHESEKRLRALLRNSLGVVTILDPDGTIRYASPSVERVLGYGFEDLIGQNALDHVHPEDKQRVRTMVAATVQGGAPTVSAEFRFRHANGSWRHLEGVGTNLVDDPSMRGVVINSFDVTERKRTENELQRSLDALLAIYEAGHILGSTLEAEEIGSRLLHLMQRISESVTAVISVPGEDRQPRVWRAVGFENLWRRARYTPEVQDTLRAVMGSGEYVFCRVPGPEPSSEPMDALFLPLRIRNRTVGVLEVYGPDAVTEKDVLDILLNLTTKAASALENARLYGKLAERERQLQELVGKLMVAQEEERRRVAYEVHDGPTQVAVAAYQHLQAFARDYPPATPEGEKALGEAVQLARRTVGESRDIIANLRPTVLDDFGLATAVRLQVEALGAGGLRVSFEETLGEARIPDPVESALYRVAQEALANVRKHAQADRARVRLCRIKKGLRLSIRDWGVGIETTRSPGGGPGERVGLPGMRERVALVGGRLEIYSKTGEGTLIVAEVTLLEGTVGGNAGLMERLALSEHEPLGSSGE